MSVTIIAIVGNTIMKSTLGWRYLAVVIVAGLLTAPYAFAQKDEQAEVLMQAAHQKELVEGQLEEAIRLYKRIVQEHAGSRAVAAQALLEIGQCYEKLGNTEARKAYESLLRDYADQNELAAQARKRLVAISGKAVSDSSEMVTRRVWAEPGEYIGGSISPDGRYLSCVDMSTGDLAVRELATGKMRHLTHKSSTESGEYAFFSTISPDGKEVAYNWFGGKDGPDLRVVRWDGSAPRVIYAKKGLYPFPADWSPDGKYILTHLYNEAGANQIAVISAADGSARVSKTVEWSSLMLRFSPDGRYIAYDAAPAQDSGNRDIFLLSADGSREIRLVEHPADDQLLGWTPDGTHILFASDRSGTMSVWLLRVSDGKPQGAPELVKQDIGQAQPIGFTRTGSFYYGLVIGASDVYTADFDPATGKVVTQPQRAAQRFVGSNFSPAWSPDGQFLAYLSSRGPGLIGHRPEIITIRSLKTGEERDLPAKLSFTWGPIRWSPDGRSILVPGKDNKIQHGLFLVDAQTGEVTPTVMWEDRGISFPAWFPDGKRLLYGVQRRQAGTTSGTIVIRDLATGQENVLFQRAPDENIADLALSPDGRQIAVTLFEQQTRSYVLKVLPVAGTDARELVRLKEPEELVGDSLNWSPDSQYIVFVRAVNDQKLLGGYFPHGRETQMLAISSHGGEPHALGVAMDSATSVSFDPAGQRIAFAAGTAKSEIWVMENFLPTQKAVGRR
jgi:Tol biopolymer transport system component